ncbi:MAG: hypothetical protein ACR2HG_11140 [Pyrinomonadaceae bacterium]
MKSQFAQENLDNKSAQIPPAQRVYAFADLPKETQEKLLQLQNTDGDFLKLSNGETARRVILLILLTSTIIGLAAIVADSSNDNSLDLKRIIVFSADALLLLLWLIYFVWQLFKTVGSPLKNLVYLTPTQVIETLDGFFRCRELKDARIVSQQNLSDAGRTYTLNIEFDDGDFYNYWFGNYKKNFQRRNNWEAKARIWQSEAVSAFQRGDNNFFESHDVFSKLSESNTPVLQRKFTNQKENHLLIMTIALIVLNGSFIFYLTK